MQLTSDFSTLNLRCIMASLLRLAEVGKIRRNLNRLNADYRLQEGAIGT